jgi:hypothetical protein
LFPQATKNASRALSDDVVGAAARTILPQTNSQSNVRSSPPFVALIFMKKAEEEQCTAD